MGRVFFCVHGLHGDTPGSRNEVCGWIGLPL